MVDVEHGFGGVIARVGISCGVTGFGGGPDFEGCGSFLWCDGECG